MADVVTTWAGADYWLRDIGDLADITWETEWPYGCTVASWDLSLGRIGSAGNATRIGADVRVYDGPICVWGGYLSEPDGNQLHAKGYYARAEQLLALDATGAPTSIPAVAVAQAIARGWNITVATPLSNTPLSDTSETVEFNTVAALLDRYAASLGMRWKVDELGRLTVAADPITPRWHLDNAEALQSVADDDSLSAIYGRYVSAEISGKASDWAVAPASTPTPPNLRREASLDLTPLGFITSGAATTETTNRLALAAARRGYTSGIEVPFGELSIAGGAPARLGHVKAGEMVRAYNAADAAGIMQIGATQDIVIGRTAYADGADTLAVTPIGLVPRQLSTILAAPQAPPPPFEATPT